RVVGRPWARGVAAAPHLGDGNLHASLLAGADRIDRSLRSVDGNPATFVDAEVGSNLVWQVIRDPTRPPASAGLLVGRGQVDQVAPQTHAGSGQNDQRHRLGHHVSLVVVGAPTVDAALVDRARKR